MVVNVHERAYPVAAAELAAVLSTLASGNDRVWPREDWPRMRFEEGLVPGAQGGHGPVRYVVEAVDPRREISFRFTGPSGFIGRHSFSLHPSDDSAVLRHEIALRPRGWARLSWPLFFRPLHDALIEEALDKVGRELGFPPRAAYRRSSWVRFLRWLVLPHPARQPISLND